MCSEKKKDNGPPENLSCTEIDFFYCADMTREAATIMFISIEKDFIFVNGAQKLFRKLKL